METFMEKDKLEIGVDEAGRGPLFGRVYAGAVIWPPGLISPLIKDSKKLSERALAKAYQFVLDNAVAYGIAYADEDEIDEMNILNATINTMHKAIRQCCLIPDSILVDGNQFHIYSDKDDNPIDYATITKGDDTYYSIAAASILAKYARDHYIYQLCDQYPELETRYNIRKNKGYGAKAHMNGIKEHGITRFHRKTFGICKKTELGQELKDCTNVVA